MNQLQRWAFTVLCASALTFTGGYALAKGEQGKKHGKHAAEHAKKADDDRGSERHRPAPTSGSQMRFRGLDTNHDGMISRSEWRGSDQSFRVHDRNHDGVLSGDEVRSGGNRPSGPVSHPGGHDPDAALFAQLDRNHDGVLSPGEYNGTAQQFDRIDFDHNGVLTPYEFGVRR